MEQDIEQRLAELDRRVRVLADGYRLVEQLFTLPSRVAALEERFAALESKRATPPAYSLGRAATGPLPPRSPGNSAQDVASAFHDIAQDLVPDMRSDPDAVTHELPTPPAVDDSAPLPCPFCGSTAGRETKETDNKLWYIRCYDCTAHGSLHIDKDDAIVDWNRVARAVMAQGGAA